MDKLFDGHGLRALKDLFLEIQLSANTIVN